MHYSYENIDILHTGVDKKKYVRGEGEERKWEGLTDPHPPRLFANDRL